jgi:hypothetical protein
MTHFWKGAVKGLALLVGVLLVISFTLSWYAGRKLQSQIAAIRAAGDPMSIGDLAPAPTPDERNAAFHLGQISRRLEVFADQYAAFHDSELGKAFESANERGGPPAAEPAEAVRKLVNDFAEIDEALTRAAACDEYASQADFSVAHPAFIQSLLDSQRARGAARFLKLRMEVFVADGKAEEAVTRGIQMLRLARLCEREPGLVRFLVSVAVRRLAAEELYDALAAGKVSSQLHELLDKELSLHDDAQRLLRALKTERAINISGFDASPGPANPIVMSVAGWSFKSMHSGVLDSYDEHLARAALLPYELESNTNIAANSGVLARLLAPAIESARVSFHRDLVTLRTLRIVNALRQFAARNGREATGVNELPLTKNATADPFTGEPLKLKRTEKGWIVYSVMENGVDDKGNFTGYKDFGLAPPGLRHQ